MNATIAQCNASALSNWLDKAIRWEELATLGNDPEYKRECLDEADRYLELAAECERELGRTP